ncbi:MAG TPA: outer membrane beta-barrel protein [Rhizomicrobium sp.]|nr:outer membrane beta-barrel protein [Rhizomicrobium sp.]
MAWLLAVAVSAQSPVAAQAFSRTGVPSVLPVYRMSRPPYDAPKLELGSFMLAPSVEQSLTGADNIFASDRVRVGDVVSTTSEDLKIQSQWSRHSLNGHVHFSQEFYKDHASEGANMFGAEGGGRFDISNNATLALEVGFVQQPQKRNSPQADIASRDRPIYNTLSGAIGYNQDWNLLRNQIRVEVTKTAYIADAQAGRSATELRYHDRLSFAANAYVWPFVQATYATRNWLRDGGTRNFDTVTAMAGFRTEITDLVDAEFGAGILRQNYRHEKFDTLVRPAFSGQVIWNVLPLTTLSASADRTVTGIESFCDRSLRLACDTLAGNSIPQLLDVLNSYSGCGDGHCGDIPQYYAEELRAFTNAVQYRSQFNLPPPDPAKFLKSVPASLLGQFPGLSANGVADPAQAVRFGEELRQALLRYGRGSTIGLSDQRGTLEVISFELGIQHEFWHNLLGEVRFRYEEDKFDPAGLIDKNYFLNANGRILINRNLALDISYTYNARDANQDIRLYNSGSYSGNAVSLTLKAAM